MPAARTKKTRSASRRAFVRKVEVFKNAPKATLTIANLSDFNKKVKAWAVRRGLPVPEPITGARRVGTIVKTGMATDTPRGDVRGDGVVDDVVDDGPRGRQGRKTQRHPGGTERHPRAFGS